jgi:hypothetical protein
MPYAIPSLKYDKLVHKQFAEHPLSKTAKKVLSKKLLKPKNLPILWSHSYSFLSMGTQVSSKVSLKIMIFFGKLTI